MPSNTISKKDYPIPNSLFCIGKRCHQIIMSRLRLGCSLLRSDLYHNLHVIPSPKCDCNPLLDETCEHYFFNCPLYNDQRNTLRNNLLPLDYPYDNLDIETILNGSTERDKPSNVQFILFIQQYIQDTERFIP